MTGFLSLRGIKVKILGSEDLFLTFKPDLPNGTRHFQPFELGWSVFGLQASPSLRVYIQGLESTRIGTLVQSSFTVKAGDYLAKLVWLHC